MNLRLIGNFVPHQDPVACWYQALGRQLSQVWNRLKALAWIQITAYDLLLGIQFYLVGATHSTPWSSWLKSTTKMKFDQARAFEFKTIFGF